MNSSAEGGDNLLIGVRVGRSTLKELVYRSVSAIDGSAARVLFVCANPHSMVVAAKDRQFHTALTSATHVVSDGIGCHVAAFVTGRDFGPRVTGFDYFSAVMRSLNERGGKVFFLGSTSSTLSRITERCSRDYPKLSIYTRSPPFGEWSEAENDQILRAIADVSPDVLWIGLTAPKQEKWAVANREKLGVPVIGCIGAVFDYYAGTIRRAPAWLCKAGLEWLYRLAGEPRRLWHRTLVSFPVFMWLVINDRTGRSKQPSR